MLCHVFTAGNQTPTSAVIAPPKKLQQENVTVKIITRRCKNRRWCWLKNPHSTPAVTPRPCKGMGEYTNYSFCLGAGPIKIQLPVINKENITEEEEVPASLVSADTSQSVLDKDLRSNLLRAAPRMSAHERARASSKQCTHS